MPTSCPVHRPRPQQCRPWFIVIAATMLFISINPRGVAHAQDPLVPPAEQILESLKPVHPRLLIDADALEQLKQKLESGEPVLVAWKAKLRRRADALVTAPPSRYEIPDGKRLLATSRRVLDRVYLLALIYHLDGDQRHLDRAWRELEAAAKFKDWNPSHFLDTAEMTHAFAIGYDWLYHHWTDQQRTTLRNAMIKHGLEPALACYRGQKSYGWWVRSPHNWNQVCNGGVATGALAIADERPELAGETLSAGLESLKRAMRSYAPDGAWGEGPGYWNYATAYNVTHLAALQSALGTEFGFSEFNGFNHTGDFPIYMTGPLGRTFNFADGGDRRVRAPHFFWLARQFNQPAYALYQTSVASPHPLDLLWYPESPQAESFPRSDLPLDRYFRKSEVVTMRNSWDDPDALFVGFKAGDNRVNHSNLDIGSFILDALGERWVIDLGADNYNLPAYFGNKRWTYYRMRAEGHNTLVINPGSGPDQDPRASTRIVKHSFNDDRAHAIADLTPAYAKHARKVQRGIAMIDNRSRIIVQDEIEADTDVEVSWFLHTRATVTLNDNKSTATLTNAKGSRLRVQILEPTGAEFDTMPAAPLPTSPNPSGQNANKGVTKLVIALSTIKESRLVVLLTPLQAKSPTPLSPIPAVVPLAEW